MAEQRKISSAKKYALCCVVLWVWLVAAISTQNPRFNTGMGIDLAAALLMSVLVISLRQTPLGPRDCFILFPLLVCEMLTVPYMRYKTPLFALVLLIDVCLLTLMRNGRIREFSVNITVTCGAATVMLYIYFILIEKMLPAYFDAARLYGWSSPVKFGAILTAGAVMTAAFMLLFSLLGKLLSKMHFGSLSLTQSFREIEIYVLMLLVITLIFLTITEFFPGTSDPVGRSIRPFFALAEVFMILVEILYVCLLVKAASIKERVRVAEENKTAVASYASELELNLDELRDVRHDVKNLFLTMGGFVERSGDGEMKEYYEEKIVPFVKDTVLKSELQAKLTVLRDDFLKSFFYYKITEKTSRGIDVSLDIQSPMSIDIGCADITRVMGILIDNAAEEAELADGKTAICISENENEIILRISNSVRAEKRAVGVIAGSTDKGLGRGRGLLIAEKIISKYDNLILNSFFTDEGFTELLRIMKN